MPSPSNVIMGVGRPNFRTKPQVVVVTSLAMLSSTFKNGHVTLSNNNLTATATLRGSGRADTIIISGTKRYYEFTIVSMPAQYNAYAGWVPAAGTFGDSDWLGSGASAGVGYTSTGEVFFNGGVVSTWATFAQGDIISFAFNGSDAWRRVNGGLWNEDAGANPATGTNPVFMGEGDIYPAYDVAENGAGGSVTFNPGPNFAFSVPSGFSGFP